MMTTTLVTTPEASAEALVAPEAVATEVVPRRRLRSCFRLVRRALGWVASACDWVFGALALTVGLAVLAAIPVLQFMSLGYLLESGARVARSGRLRDGFVGFRKASRVGSLVAGVWLCLLPLQIVSSMALSAELIDPGGRAARQWKFGLLVLTAVMVVHVLAACSRGGRLRHFAVPFANPLWIVRRWRRGGAYAAGRDAVWAFVASLNLPRYFRLGALGFGGTMAWLVVPVSLLAVGRRFPALGFLGALLLGIVVMSLPFLQLQFAMTGRFRAFFGWREARARYCRAPWAFVAALAVLLSFAVPLYLLKIEIIPREAAWLPSLVFVAFIFPSRLLTAWAFGRSSRRETPRHWFFRWTGRLALVPLAAAYVLIVVLSQFTAWRGVWSLYEQHAFLLPVPFLGL